MRIAGPLTGAENAEVSALIAQLHNTGKRLEELTVGEVDAVADHDGNAFLLYGAQEKLRQIEAARQASILNALPAHIALLDALGTIISVNDAWRQYAVANASQCPGHAIGVNYLEVCASAPGDDSPGAHEIAAGIRSVLGGTARTFSFEYPCHSPSAQHWFLVRITPLAAGRASGAVVMHLNITERKQAEETQQRQQTELRVLFDLLPAMIWFKDTDNRILRINEHAAAAAGMSVDEIEGSPSLEIYPHDAAKYYADDLEVIRSGIPKLGIVEALHSSDGKELWVQTDKVPVRDKNGMVLGVCVMAQDITERTRNALQLRESERRFSDLLRNVRLISVMLDRDARITYCNEYFLTLTGWREDELIGRSWFDVFVQAAPGGIEALFAALLADVPEALHNENEIVTRSGEPRLIRWNNSVLRSSAGDVIGTASIGEDITEQKRAETRIKRLNRVYAVLSGINTLIVRVNDRDELFREACRIAVEHGKFTMAWVGIVDRSKMDLVPVASAGVNEDALRAIRARFSASLIENASLKKSMAAQAIVEKQVIISNDTQNDDKVVFSKQFSGAGVRSMVMLPLIVANDAVGLLALYSGETGFFDEEELTLLKELAGDISFAIAHIGKEEKIARLSRIQAVTSGINSAIVRVRDRQELFSEACRIVVEEGKLGFAWIGLLDPATQDVTPVAWAGESAAELTRTKSSARADTPQGKGAVARAIRERRPIFNNDITNHPFGGPRLQKILQLGFKSQITLPLFEGAPVVGTLTMYAKEQDVFVAEELALLTELAANISFALDHIGKEEKIARLSRIQAVMSGINSAIVHIGGRQELFNEACRIAVEQGGFGIAWIGKLDTVTEDITPVAWAGIDAEVTTTRRSSRADSREGQGLCGRAVREKTPVFDNDIAKRPDMGGGGRKVAVGRGYRSLIALPLLAEGAVLGTLSLFATEPDFFDAEELALLTELAGNLAFAIAHIDRQEKLAKLSRIRAVSSEINAAIVRITERDALLEEVCQIAREHGKFRFIWMAAVDAAKQQIRAVAWTGFSPDAARAVSWAAISATAGTLAEAIHTRKPAMRGDIYTGELKRGLRHEAVEQGYRSNVCLPLIVGDRVVALIALFAPGVGFFDREELALLNEVAANVSFALENFEKEEKIARLSRIQSVTSEINALIVRVRGRQELFDEVCRIAVEHGKFGTAWIGALNVGTNELSSVAWAGHASEDLARTRTSWHPDVDKGTGVVSSAIRAKRPVFDNDIVASEKGRSPRRTAAINAGFRSLIAVPFVTGDVVVGHLALYAREADYFNEEEVKLLAEVAGNIAFALENIDRQEKLEKLSRIRAVSSQINAAIVRITTRDALLKDACRIAKEFGKFELVWIAALDRKTEKVLPIAWAGFPEEVALAVDWKSITGVQAVIAESVRTGKLSVRDDISSQATSGVLRKEALKRDCLSTVSLPLVVDEIVEVVIVLFAQGTDFFDQDELVLLGEVASDLSFALQSITRREQLDYLAYYDALTGLANRTLFLERVGQYMRSAVSSGQKLAVGLFDLERFKNINDSLGQPAGDALLKQVAEWLTQNMGDANLLARVGADHFAVVLPVVNPRGDVAHLVEKTLAAFLDYPFRLNDAVFRIAVKAGVALFPDDGADADALFRNAEAALKKAKASGDRYLFYTQKMTAAVAGRLTLENQLRQALENEEFVLHYQPKVNLESGKLTSCEALIRWNDPRTGLVPPFKFIPILEETGLINEVGRWALRKAIGDHLRWRTAGLPAVRIAVNVSPLQLRNPGFISEVEQAIGLDPHAAAGLELEITESLIMADVKHSIASLQTIRAMGVTIAIDDFGTGFSSLSYLAKLPVDTLKIDRSFVIDMTAGPEGLALVSTIINLAHSLKLKVVAEGVETEEQSRLLRLLNCDEMQGYLFSKPVPAEMFETRFLVPAPAVPIVEDA